MEAVEGRACRRLASLHSSEVSMSSGFQAPMSKAHTRCCALAAACLHVCGLMCSQRQRSDPPSEHSSSRGKRAAWQLHVPVS